MQRPTFQRLEELFHKAVDLSPVDREAFLERECADNPEMRAALENMLRHDREDTTDDGRLASPIANVASALRHDAPTLPAGSVAGATVRSTLPEVPDYELLEELGRGGMGVVYKARQIGLNRLVALKMLLPFAAPTTEQLARFRTEAEALARLSHPNVVPIYDVGECAAGPYFSMEYVPGPSLAAYLEGKPCDPAAAARLIEVLAGAMDAVHHRGIVHRDLKPANVLLSPRRDASHSGEFRPGGRQPLSTYDPKITDFGLAKDRAARQALTMTGTTLGTPCYMAPEQANSQGDGIGPAADLYSLGAILYELLTGRPPFEGVTPVATIARLLDDDPPPPSRLRAGLPRDLITICMKCLEKSPRRRYASARVLAEDLRRFQAGEPIRARPLGPFGRTYRWCRRHALVAALIALCTGLIIAFVVTVVVYDFKLRAALNKSQSTSEEEREEIVHLNVTIGISEMEGGDTYAAILRFTEALRRDGGNPERERNHRTRIAAALRQSPHLARIFVPGGDILAAQLTGSGGRIATISPARLVDIWDVATGQKIGRPVQLASDATEATFGPGGRSLTTLGDGVTQIWDLEHGTSRQLARSISADAHSPGLQNPLSEDGRLELALSDKAVEQVRDVATGEAIGQPLKSPGAVLGAAVSANGKRIAVVGQDNSVRIGDSETGQWLARPLAPRFPVKKVVFSQDGELLLTAGKNQPALIWKAATGELVASLTAEAGEIAYARFSPDGKLLITDSSLRYGRLWDIASGQPLTPRLPHAHQLISAAFSTDGRQLITAGKAGALCVWELPHDLETGIENRASPVALRNLETIVSNRVTSPNGKRLTVLATNRGEVKGAQVLDEETREPFGSFLVHGSSVRLAALSGNASRVITADQEGLARVWDVATGELLAPARRMAHAISRVAFDADGNRAILICGGKECIWDLTPDDRTPEELEALAEVLACGSIADLERREAFAPRQLFQAWNSLHKPR